MRTIVPPRAVTAMARRRRGRPVGNLLLACVRGEAWRTSSADRHEACRVAASLAARPAPLDGLPAAARFHGVAGYVHRVLSRVEGMNATVVGELESLRAGGLHVHLRAVGDLPVIREALGAAGVPWLVVKGPVLGELHGAPDLRAYSDLDLVVPAAGFGDALEALERAGARPLASNWSHRLEVLAGEVPLVLPSGTAVDLHWHVLNEHRLRRVFDLRMAPLLARARQVEVLDRPVRTLEEADLLLHLALHTAMSGGNRLVWLKDVERILAVAAPDPTTVVERASAAGLELVVATVLDRVRTTLGMPVRPAALAELDASRAWRLLAALARRIPPPERATAGGSVDRLVSRATRVDLPASAAELVRRAMGWSVRGRNRHHGGVAPVGDQGEAAARRAFLAAVERAGDL